MLVVQLVVQLIIKDDKSAKFKPCGALQHVILYNTEQSYNYASENN